MAEDKTNGSGNGHAKRVGRPFALTPQQIAEAAMFESKGWNIAQIAAHYAVKPATIRAAFARLDAGDPEP
jgi:hypothetical protein